MAEVYGAVDTPIENNSGTASNKLVFEGTQRNLVVGLAMLATGALAFSMDLTHTFFAEAMAWTFVLWGVLFLYGNLLDIYQTYEVTDEALIIKNPLRPWGATKVWDWAHLHRMDVVVKRAEAELDDAVMQIYYTPEGEIVIEREDRAYNPELARLIIERAGLKPTAPENPKDLVQLPPGKRTYFWNKSGRIAAS
jgi:hypothetical protein